MGNTQQPDLQCGVSVSQLQHWAPQGYTGVGWDRGLGGIQQPDLRRGRGACAGPGGPRGEKGGGGGGGGGAIQQPTFSPWTQRLICSIANNNNQST